MCAILGIKGIFSVKINKDEPVSELKNKIKPADPIGASALKLYKINIRVPIGTAFNTLIDSIHRRTIDFNERDELEDPFCELSTIPGEFPQRHLHILVEVPAGESFSSRPGRDVAEIMLSLTTPWIIPCDDSLIIHYHAVYPSMIVYHPLQSLTSSICFVLGPHPCGASYR